MRVGERERAKGRAGRWWCVWWKKTLALSKAVKGHCRPLPTHSIYSLSILSQSRQNAVYTLLLTKDARVCRRLAWRCGILVILFPPAFLTQLHRQSPHLRNQPGHNSSNRGPHSLPPLLNLLIRSVASQTSLAISPRLPPRPLFFPPFPSQSFPVHHTPFETYFSFMLIVPRWLAYGILVRASRALRLNIPRQNARR